MITAYMYTKLFFDVLTEVLFKIKKHITNVLTEVFPYSKSDHIYPSNKIELNTHKCTCII